MARFYFIQGGILTPFLICLLVLGWFHFLAVVNSTADVSVECRHGGLWLFPRSV